MSAVHPGDHVADRELWLPPPSIARQYHTARYHTIPRNDQDSKFQVSFLLNAYCFHNIVKSKNSKWNPYKSGTGDIYVLMWKAAEASAYPYNDKVEGIRGRCYVQLLS